MCRVFCVIAVSFQLVAQVPELAWQQWAKEVRQHVASQRWYEAKRVLATLEASDKARFEHEQFTTTLAWIHLHHKYYESAAFHYARLDTKHPELALEHARSLIGCQDFDLAHQVLASIPDRLCDRFQLLEKKLAMADCAVQIGNNRLALQLLHQLRGNRTSQSTRVAALIRLVHLQYRLGNVSAARQAVDTLSQQWPASDEALEAVKLQAQVETESFLQKPDELAAQAWVYYRNRQFEAADACYTALIENPKTTTKTREKAYYFRSIAKLKQEDPAKAIEAFSHVLPLLEGSPYHGMAHFQYIRALFMVGRDYDVTVLSQRAQSTIPKEKWRYEIAKLWILALRRMGNYQGFNDLSEQIHQGPAWIQRFYHRNGVVWALHLGDTTNAAAHLSKYRNLGPDPKEQLELNLWQGLIEWNNNRPAEAVAAWLEVAKHDPNHYTGLVARSLIDKGKQSAHLGIGTLPEFKEPLADLLNGFHLADNDEVRRTYSEALGKHAPKWRIADAEAKAVLSESIATWVHVGRFDLAADEVRQESTGLPRPVLHLLKSHWYLSGQRVNAAIYHAEILGRTLPQWLPLETVPREIRQLLYPQGFAPIVQRRAESQGVDPYLLLAIIREESRFKEDAKSVASARGLMQFIPSTAQRVALDLGRQSLELNDLYDPEISVALGAAYVDILLKSLGDVPLYSVAAYNAGEDAVQRWRSMADRYDPLQFVWDITYTETRQYCHKVMGAYHHYQQTYEPQSQYSVIQVPSMAQLAQ